jgi:ectoine hydroxylase-related dioxygenase (phytanoyl-CoA dioxygenase family)
MNEIKKNIQLFNKKGFAIFDNFLSTKDVENLKQMLVDGYKENLNHKINEENISKYISKFEKEEKYDELYHAFQEIKKSEFFLKIGKKINNFYQDNFQINSKLIASGYAVGIKDSKRTAYDWHQEKPYYSNANTIHFQFPILYPCQKDNGTMSVLEGSHHLGYIEDVINIQSHNKAVNTFVPKNIDKIKASHPEKYLNLSLRDLGLFDQNIIHKSNRNLTDKIRFAGIIRLEILD